VACPDDNTLVAMLERALDPARLAEIEVHIDSCEHCRRVVGEAGNASQLALGSNQVPPTLPAEGDAAPRRPSEPVFDGRYEIERVLGQGGMGKVYLARDKTLGREVALKVHRAGSGVDRLHREAIAMAKLAHPNAVTVFEVGTVDDRLYVAMEYVRGTTLRGWLALEVRPWREVLAKLIEAGRGLAAAHAAGLIHRDFKPENVLVGDDGRPRVGDFGLARVGKAEPSEPSSPEQSTDAKMTETGTVLGTPAYMALEQIHGEVVDARADQFAFCVVAWEALYGARPFTGKTLGALAAAISDGALPRPARTEIPDRVRHVLSRGLSATAGQRYADMPALLSALEAAAAPRTRRVLALAIAGTLVVGGTAAFGATTLLAQHRDKQCTLAGSEIRGVFSPEVRAQLQQAFAASGSQIQAASFERMADVLARHTESLARAAETACRTSDDEPARLAEARRRCLADEVSAMRSLIGVMMHPEPATVARAPSAAWGLWSAAPCADPSALLAGRAPAPASTALASEYAAVKALLASGGYEVGEARATKLLEAARGEKNPDAELATLLVLAELRAEISTPDQIAPLLHDAVALAEREGRDLEAIRALAQLANLTGVEQHDYAAAHRHAQLALAKLARLGDGNPALRGALLGIEGQVLLDENRLAEADDAMRRAIVELERAYGPDHPDVAEATGTLSQVQRARGDLQGSLASSQRTLTVLERAFGPEHPLVAGSQMNLATPLIALGRLDEARPLLEHADQVFARVYGEVHPVRAGIYGNLGQLEEAAGKPAAAQAAYERATKVLEAVEGPDSANVSGARRDIARMIYAQGKVEEAIAEQTRAIAILEKLGDDGAPRLVSALVELANFELDRDRFAHGLAIAERALGLGLARPAEANPDELAVAKFAVARGLVGIKGDRVRAKKLFDEARTAITDERRAMLDAWRAGPGASI